ncbi:hypothetical protein MTR_7g079410 [Medicago truncatula]|uniref:Uncharacterized protein n=1 Tax=Medicago truncatula TaxID=3880 RepID=Q2HV78_MEDTR|nr:hypothetical protein MtrDRAFT_AC148994g30v2 [Medicago truncatula]AES80332.2 hypothetical protein MTR_7g079410 [Medicago truncatula]
MRGRAVVDDFNNRRSLRLITAEAAVKIGSRSVQIEGLTHVGEKLLHGDNIVKTDTQMAGTKVPSQSSLIIQNLESW